MRLDNFSTSTGILDLVKNLFIDPGEPGMQVEVCPHGEHVEMAAYDFVRLGTLK